MANHPIGIGHSPLTDKIYVGRQNISNRMWVGEKEDTTNQFLAVSLSFFKENFIREIEDD